MIKKLRLAGLMLVLAICTTCNEKIFTGDVDCDECYSDKPSHADLVIDLTIDNQYPSVPVIVYKGDFEDNEIIAVDTADYTPFYVWVRTDRKYSVKAEYKSGGKTLFAVNGAHIKVLSVADACDENCYVIENDHINLRIKNGFP